MQGKEVATYFSCVLAEGEISSDVDRTNDGKSKNHSNIIIIFIKKCNMIVKK